jgi:aquaporin Z
MTMFDALRRHWPEYAMEAAELGTFMISASVFTILLYHPESPFVRLIPLEVIRRALVGVAMGLTLIGLVYSPWGKRSGAHMNPAFTLTFYRLGKVAPWDAIFYVLAQFAGGILGISVVAAIAPRFLAHPAVNYVSTLPGAAGSAAAFAGEFVISFLLAGGVLFVANTAKLADYTGVFAGFCVAAFIFLESPLSGMSMNPARTFGSALLPGLWKSLWIYFTAPPLGMLAGSALYSWTNRKIGCAKLHHQNDFRCIFCNYHSARKDSGSTRAEFATSHISTKTS